MRIIYADPASMASGEVLALSGLVESCAGPVGGGGDRNSAELAAAVLSFSQCYTSSPADVSVSVGGHNAPHAARCTHGVLSVIEGALRHDASCPCEHACPWVAASATGIRWFKSALRSPAVQGVAVARGAFKLMLDVVARCGTHQAGACTGADAPFSPRVACDALKAANNVLVVAPATLDAVIAQPELHNRIIRLLQCHEPRHADVMVTLCRLVERAVACSAKFASLLVRGAAGGSLLLGLASCLADCVRRKPPCFPRGTGRLQVACALLDLMFALAGESGLVAEGVLSLPAELQSPVAQVVLLAVEVRTVCMCVGMRGARMLC